MATKDIPDELNIELSRPVTMAGGGDSTTYTEIALHEPTVKQLSDFIKQTQKVNAIDSMKSLISSVSGVPLPVIEQIGVRDFYKAQDYLILFITPPEDGDPAGK